MKWILLCLGILGSFNACQSRFPSNPISEAKDSLPPTSAELPPAEPSLDVKIGQMIMIGILKRTYLLPSDTLAEDLRAQRIGGIILFEKNIAKTASFDSLQLLIQALQAQSTIPLLISIDEEGGKVHRLKEKYGFVPMPSAAWLGKKNNLDTTYHYNLHLAKELAKLGINTNYAPAIDVAVNPNNPIIAKVERSYSSDPQLVSQHAKAAIKAHHYAGVKTIVKHFPGHGSSANDTHLGIADVSKTWKEEELVPFKSIIEAGLCDAVMTAHIVHCGLDSNCLPATLSEPIIQGILRKRLGFNGPVFSDDMQMNAISKQFGLEEAVRRAILAGVDVLVFGNNVHAQDRIPPQQLHALIKNLVISGKIPESRINESYHRIMRFKSYIPH
ncbi:MAG: glycoside hydrolase family 3 protein [Cytophagaceae bacterium]|jgi:beta-N-acetylhexosaminidase|nr:glycoside hydrolase family 3 protein [Cytophagaceae bacterium]